MLRRCVCVSFYGREESYPDNEEITDIFRKYGRIERIISHKTFKDHLFVEFMLRQAAVQCFMQKQAIFQQNGFIVELKDKDSEEQGHVGGKEDPDSPSIIMDLNDDCLLHLLSYLQEESAVKFVSVRIRQLCKLLWRKERRFTIGRRYKPCLDRLYHSGDYATHLSVYEIYNAYDFIFSLCKNLKYLGLLNLTFERETMDDVVEYERIDLKMVKNIGSVTELELLQVKENDLSVMFRDNTFKLEKLSLITGNILFSEIPTMSSLTTIMILESKIDVGQILHRFPQIKVLACILDKTSHPIPDNNNLQELFVISENRKSDLLEIRRSCPQLRHLRVQGGDNILQYGVRQFLPLDGLHLSDLEIDDSGLVEISFLANDLKIFFLSDCWINEESDEEIDMESVTAYAKVLSKFKNLQITSWQYYLGNIDFFLTNRPANSPLKIITEFKISSEQKLLSPTCEWVPNFQSIFGTFSIYKSEDEKYEFGDDGSESDDYHSSPPYSSEFEYFPAWWDFSGCE